MTWKRKVLPLAALTLVAALASCAPTVQTAGASYRPNTVAGGPYLLAAKVPADQLTEATPDSSYVTFDDCFRVAVSVPDVRRLGLREADRVCRETRRNIEAVGGGFNVLAGFALFLTGLFGFFLFGQVLR